jgi:hypothetical protein
VLTEPKGAIARKPELLHAIQGTQHSVHHKALRRRPLPQSRCADAWCLAWARAVRCSPAAAHKASSVDGQRPAACAVCKSVGGLLWRAQYHQALGAGRMAQYGYCASHSRYFWGLRLHLVCTLHDLPVTFALTGAKADEREVLLDLLAVEPELVAARPGQTLLADKHCSGREFEGCLASWACGGCGRPARASPNGRERSCSSRCGS